MFTHKKYFCFNKTAIIFRVLLIFMLSGLFFIGCYRYQFRLYQGEVLPKKNVAIVVASQNIRFLRVDGNKLPDKINTQKKIELRPGRHEFIFKCRFGEFLPVKHFNIKYHGTYDIYKNFYLEAGQYYFLGAYLYSFINDSLLLSPYDYYLHPDHKALNISPKPLLKEVILTDTIDVYNIDKYPLQFKVFLAHLGPNTNIERPIPNKTYTWSYPDYFIKKKDFDVDVETEGYKNLYFQLWDLWNTESRFIFH